MRYKIEEPEDSSGILRPEMVDPEKHICVWYPGEGYANNWPYILMRREASDTWLWQETKRMAWRWGQQGKFDDILRKFPLDQIAVYDSPAEAYADLAEYYRKREG